MDTNERDVRGNHGFCSFPGLYWVTLLSVMHDKSQRSNKTDRSQQTDITHPEHETFPCPYSQTTPSFPH